MALPPSAPSSIVRTQSRVRVPSLPLRLSAPGTAYFRSYLGRRVQSWTIHSAVVESRAQMRRWKMGRALLAAF